MAFARRIGVALAIVGLVVTPATATAQHASPGYSYRLRITGRVTEPNGRTTDYVVMSGRALVTEKAGRLDIDDASWKRGAIAEKDDHILYDSASMTIVSPKFRQVARLPLENPERTASPASTQDARATIGDVTVTVEKLGAGAPMLGMATTRYRLTQNYDVATTGAAAKRSSTEHVVQELSIADERKALANPFARLIQLPVGAGSGFDELSTKTAEARESMGRGIPLEMVITSTSTSSRNEVTRTVTTMEVSALQPENVDDDILVAPTDYQVVALNDLARSAPSSQRAQPGNAKVARPAPTDDAAGAAKGEFVKTLHGMGRRP
jgi:hypothetical protein